MRTPLLLLAFLLVAFPLQAQHQGQFDAFNQKRQTIFKQHTLGVGSWALANMAYSGGTLLLGDTHGSTMHAHRANVGWNMVNMAIVLPGYLRSQKREAQEADLQSSIRSQLSMERIVLVNAALNVTYIVAGISFSNQGQIRNNSRTEGFGRSLIIQGSFLLLADGITFFRLKKHSDTLWDRVEIGGGSYGMGLTIRL
jgi:hypothetical protein